MPFGEITSDHRGLWLDLTHNNVYGSSHPRSIIPKARRLQCNVPHVRKKWIKLYTDFLNKNKVIERQFKLEQTVQGSMSEAQKQEFEQILSLWKEGINHAEKRCRELRVGNVLCSPETQQSRFEIELWQAAYKIKTKQKYSSRKFCRLATKVGVKEALSNSKETMKQNKSIAFKKYWKTKKEARQLRKTFLNKKAEALAEDQDIEASNATKQLMQREQTRTDTRLIKVALKKINKTAVTTIEVETEEGITKELTSQNKIELACVQENYDKYTQTESTVCMKEPLKSLLGKTGNTQFCNEILAGTANFPADTPQHTVEFFEQLKQLGNIPNNPQTKQISSEDFKAGWKAMKEKTSSASKTGLHFGHMKACAMDDQLT